MDEHRDFIIDIWQQLINEEITLEVFMNYVRDYVEDNYLG